MRYSLIVGFILLLVAGCDTSDKGRDISLDDYKCTIEQLDAVDREYEICNRSSYLSSNCFAQAKKTHCVKVTGN